MRNTEYFRDKKVTIVGLARSGFASANLLYALGAAVSITDYADNELTRLYASQLRPKDIAIELGRHSQEFIKGRDMVIVSPGVGNTQLPVIWAEQFGITVISEIELAWILCPATVIAVTGTNGKTTVTTLIGKVLAANGAKAITCGNIGNTFSGELDRIETGGFVSLEVSSFQLERIQTFKPKISVILNFSRNHLDRYRDTQEYLEAKKRIFINQDKSDYLLLNQDDKCLRELAPKTEANIVYFHGAGGLNPNFAAVMAVGAVLGINKDLILSVLRAFKGIEHRLEYVAEIDNIKFINDSKATTVDSTAWALRNISQPIVLIAGGREKGNDYSAVVNLARQKVREIVLIGEAKEKIREAVGDFLPINTVTTLEEAVAVAFSKAKQGDCILLSPMCKSFDMFSNYEERGRIFKKIVYDLIKDRG